MSNFRPWAFWRRVQYGAPVVLIFTTIVVVVTAVTLYEPPTCLDGKQNGTERGVDCGGACVRICAAEVIAPQLVWAKSFEITPGQYNATAYIENKNVAAGAPVLTYTFRLFSESELVAERSGETTLPPNSTYPIFEGRITTVDRKPVTRTELTFEPIRDWYPITLGREQFRTVNLTLSGANTRPRLEVSLENTTLVDARDVEVVATIFNAAGEALTSSQTFLDTIEARTTTDTVFTWPNPIARTVRSCLVPSDIVLVLDRSGSMAADGGTPPEPLESAKRAAASFTRFLRPNDQIAFFSYATTPSTPIEQPLTTNHAEAVTAINRTTMGQEGIQYTDMEAALTTALSELQSPRQRDDNRKVIVFMTDGDVTRPVNPATGQRDIEYATAAALSAAVTAKAAEVTMYTIGFGKEFGQTGEATDRNIRLISELASSEAQSYIAPTITDLEAVYQNIAQNICEDTTTRIDVIAKTATNFKTQ